MSFSLFCLTINCLTFRKSLFSESHFFHYKIRVLNKNNIVPYAQLWKCHTPLNFFRGNAQDGHKMGCFSVMISQSPVDISMTLCPSKNLSIVSVCVHIPFATCVCFYLGHSLYLCLCVWFFSLCSGVHCPSVFIGVHSFVSLSSFFVCTYTCLFFLPRLSPLTVMLNSYLLSIHFLFEWKKKFPILNFQNRYSVFYIQFKF